MYKRSLDIHSMSSIFKNHVRLHKYLKAAAHFDCVDEYKCFRWASSLNTRSTCLLWYAVGTAAIRRCLKQNLYLLSFINVVIRGIFLGWRRSEVSPVHCSGALQKPSYRGKLPHVLGYVGG